jgi:hypothetical protein
LAPTSPAAAAEEESDAVLALELAGLLTKTQIWTRHGPTVGRWMEHYVLPGSSYPALQHQFIRDDGSGGPLLPVVAWEGLQPVTAHLLAARTRDPAAASIADTVAAAMRDRSAGILAKLWRWVPIVFDLRDVSRCDRDRLPTARNLGGAVVFRGGHGPGATVVWVEAGQPYLRHRQHFDASHFLLRSGGYLVPGDGDDVSFEAVPSKGGLQRLGNLDEDFDYEQYFVSTIAHNCMVLYDPARVPRWHRERYAPRGGQRLIEGTCTDFDTALEAHPRLTGRQLAYGHQQSAAYLALDLAPAYDRRAVAYTREFVFALDRVLVVIDRLQTTEQRIIPTWIVNLPARPTVDGRGLSAGQRVAGADNQAGVWCCDQARLIHWSDRDGSLWLWSLLPEPRKLSVVGGPASRLVIKDGPHVGRTYVGGEPDGFERLVIPSGRHHPLNAWYRLGRPTLLGAQFGETPRWGRIEIEPAHRSGQYLFVTVLAADRAGADQPPAVKSQHAGGEIEITITVGEGELLLRAGEGGATGGTLELREPRPVRWELPGEVHADGPLPVQ